MYLNGSSFLQLQSKEKKYRVKEAMQDNHVFNAEKGKRTFLNLKQCTCVSITHAEPRTRIVIKTCGKKYF